MKEFWNSRYSEKDYAYGMEPNLFLKHELVKLKPGKILFLGEGEGRNAVFAAELGWVVDAVDYSDAAKNKAEALAASKKVKINYSVEDLLTYMPKQNYYDVVALIYIHLKEELRERVHQNALSALADDGKIIIEVFEKEQIKNSSGGPRDAELLYDLQTIVEDFIDLEFEKLSKEVIELNEGEYHKGKAFVLRFIGKNIDQPPVNSRLF